MLFHDNEDSTNVMSAEGGEGVLTEISNNKQ